MIRPFTCLAFLLALASGLYLYQTKHRASVLDAQIAQTVRSTDALREQTRMLSAEWTLLNDPERLRQLATQFLTLQTVSPNQFTSLADLDSRLPPPAPPGPPATGTDAPLPAQVDVPVASNDSGRTGTDEGKQADAKVADASPSAVPKDTAPPAPRGTPVPAASPPAARIAATDQPRPADAKPAGQRVVFAAAEPRPATSQSRQPEHRAAEPMLAEARPTAPPPRVPAPTPMPRPWTQASGSMLGMAHGMVAPPAPVPLPRPMPVSTPQWANGGTGG